MSASPVFSSAALGRPFVLAHPASDPLWARLGAARKLPAITPASRLEVRPAPEMASSGICELDALTGGLPRGCLTEICGPASSGRTGILLAALAQATQRGEVCALVDASDALDPGCAAAAGIEMNRLLWIRCAHKNSSPRHRGAGKSSGQNQKILFEKSDSARTEQKIAGDRLEQVLKVTDLLLQSNGFGMIVLDLGDIPVRSARRIPLASWFRFRRAIEHTPTVLLVLEQQPIAGSCSSVLLQVTGDRSQAAGKKPPAFSTSHSERTQRKKLSAASCHMAGDRPGHAELLDKFEVTVELLRSRLERKSPQSVASFASRAAWSNCG